MAPPLSKSAYRPYPGGGGPRSRFEGGDGGSYDLGEGKLGFGLRKSKLVEEDKQVSITRTGREGSLVPVGRSQLCRVGRRHGEHACEGTTVLLVHNINIVNRFDMTREAHLVCRTRVCNQGTQRGVPLGEHRDIHLLRSNNHTLHTTSTPACA